LERVICRGSNIVRRTNNFIIGKVIPKGEDKMKKCPKCGKPMEKTIKFGNENKPYAYDVLACDGCNYDEEIIR